MKASLALTGQGIARALARIAELPAVDAAVRKRAEQVAAERGATRVLRRGPGEYVVSFHPPTAAIPPSVMPAKAGTQ